MRGVDRPRSDARGCSAHLSPDCTDIAEHLPADDDNGRFHWRCGPCHWLITDEQEREALEEARCHPGIAVRRIDLDYRDIVIREIDDEWVVIPDPHEDYLRHWAETPAELELEQQYGTVPVPWIPVTREERLRDLEAFRKLQKETEGDPSSGP